MSQRWPESFGESGHQNVPSASSGYFGLSSVIGHGIVASTTFYFQSLTHSLPSSVSQ